MTQRRTKVDSVAGPLVPPRIDDQPEEIADWAECWSLANRDGNTSFSELWSVMKVGGSADAYTEPGAFEYTEVNDSELAQGEIETANLYEAAAEAGFLEISDRLYACGNTNYPFNVTSEGISIREDAENSVYAFLLLLSRYGPNAGLRRNEGAKLFEDVCAHAVSSFLGGTEHFADAIVFGFPRRVSHNGFAAALDGLCQRIAEGEGSRSRPTTKDQKDAKLDIVGWKSFRDNRKGRLIIFGQCGTGDNWREKRTELIPTNDWCTYWMKDRPAVWPIRAFFVPHRLGDRDWFETCVHGGLLFDRCRIASYSADLPEGTIGEITKWSRHVMRLNRGN